MSRKALTGTAKVEEVAGIISSMLTKAETLFKPECILTFIMRYPEDVDCEMLMSNDSLDELEKLIQRMKSRQTLQTGLHQ